MSPFRLAGSASLLVGVLLLLSACQDPSGVGLELIGEEGRDPNVVVAVADTVFLKDDNEITGGFGDGSAPAQERVLVGAVTDLLFGDATAEAYLDIIPPTTVSSSFRDRTIVSATLRLARDYVYGDSTQALTLALYQMDEDWDPTGARADTSFAVGALLNTYAVTAADSLIELDLPASWVMDNDELLRSDTVSAAVDGFHLRLADGAMTNAIIGFDVLQSELRLRTSEDTVDYRIREVFTHLERGDVTASDPDLLFLRDGSTDVAAISFDFESIGPVALARGLLRLNVAPEASESSEAFQRPLPQTLAFFGVTEDEERFGLASATRDEDSDTYTFSTSTLTAVFQDLILGNTPFVRFEVEAATSPISLNVLPLRVGPAPTGDALDLRPRTALTIIPTN